MRSTERKEVLSEKDKKLTSTQIAAVENAIDETLDIFTLTVQNSTSSFPSFAKYVIFLALIGILALAICMK